MKSPPQGAPRGPPEEGSPPWGPSSTVPDEGSSAGGPPWSLSSWAPLFGAPPEGLVMGFRLGPLLKVSFLRAPPASLLEIPEGGAPAGAPVRAPVGSPVDLLAYDSCWC
ncbi:hypothetical protein EAH_00041050 [Eimeria acervulina]|uniref:Uncharacterized protein n=1 Tax=Eimeria acervulina TaxID=5801 RepID=U6GYN3_EIMAC|nr:hypothetical protein EAH_00041050 [Eimeria acervulina]CDI83619.1 hypothetical protein EAH_00041050 [Eimeria acervulina]